MRTVAPRARSQAASGAQALRVGSITTMTGPSPAARTAVHSDSRCALLVTKRRSDQTSRPVWSARAARWCSAQATSMPSRSSCIAAPSSLFGGHGRTRPRQAHLLDI
jgi:hypothetical protein